MTTPSERKVTPFRFLRAAATPLLAIGLVVGAWVGIVAGQFFLDTIARTETTPFSGLAAFAVGIVAVAGITTSINCGVGLWLFWRRWKRKPPV